MNVELLIRGARIVSGRLTTPPGWIAVDGDKVVALGCSDPAPEAKRVGVCGIRNGTDAFGEWRSGYALMSAFGHCLGLPLTPMRLLRRLHSSQ